MNQFTINERHISDADLGDYTAWDIEALDNENNCQYLTVYSAQDLVTLKTALSTFLTDKESILSMKQPSDNQQGESPTFADIIKGYLQTEFSPASGISPEEDATYRVMTSQEILLDLADMVELSINEVAEAMTALGYRTAKIDGKVGWLMKYNR